MNIKKCKVSELNEAKYNPRRITEKAREGLRASIDRFGLVVPLIWNKQTKTLVGGHQRLSVLKEDGLKDSDEIDVVVVDLPEDQEKALNLALNNPGSRGTFTEGTIDLMSELRESIGDAFDDLGMTDLQFVLERMDLGDKPEKTPPPKSTKPKHDGVICPKCRTKWNKKTGDIISKGVGNEN